MANDSNDAQKTQAVPQQPKKDDSSKLKELEARIKRVEDIISGKTPRFQK